MMLQAVAQVLHRRARDEDRAFQAVGDFAVQAPADGGQQVVLARHGGFARVHQHEAAGAVGVLGHAGLEAGLAEGGRLLVARVARDGDRAAQYVGCGVPDRPRCWASRLGSMDAGMSNSARISSSHCEIVDVEQHRAAGVRVVGGVDLAAGEPPDQEGVDIAE